MANGIISPDVFPDIIARFDFECKCLFINSRAEKVTGLPASSFINKTIHEINFPQELVCFFQKNIPSVFRTAQPQEFQYNINGNFFECRLIPEYCDGNEVSSVIAFIRDISELTKSIQSRCNHKKAEEKLHNLFEILPVGVSIINNDRSIVEMNSALEKILCINKEGLLRGDFKNRNYLRRDGSIMPLDEMPSIRALKERVTVPDTELGVVKEDGSVIWTSVAAAPLAEDMAVIVTADITARKKAQAELDKYNSRLEELIKERTKQLESINMQLKQEISKHKKTEESLHESYINIDAILNAANESVAMFDKKGTFIFVNATAAERLRLTIEDLVGHTLFDIFPHELAEGRMAIIRKVFRTGKPQQFEDVRDGKTFSHNACPVFKNGKVTGVVSYSKDITKFVESKKIIEHLASFPRMNPNPVLELNMEGNITYFNKAALTAIKVSNPGEVNLFLPDDIHEIIDQFKKKKKDQELNREINIKGRIFQESICYSKEFKTIRIYTTDVTERKNTEIELRKLSAAIEQNPASIVITDAMGNIEYVNPKFTRITGYSPKEAIGKNPRILQSGRTNPNVYQSLWNNITHGREWHGSLQNKNKLGNIYWEAVNISPIVDENGAIKNYVAVKEDITLRIKHEEQLKKLNRTLNAVKNSVKAIMHAANEIEYMDEVCRIIAEYCGYNYVWIGLAENDEKKSIRPAAAAGFSMKYMKRFKLTWEDSSRGQGPAATAIRTGKNTHTTTVLRNPKFMPWREELIKKGFPSALALPLKDNDNVLGALTIYSKDKQAFSPDEVNLLTELAKDLAYGISVIRLKKAHNNAVDELRKHRDHLEELIQDRTFDLETANEFLNEAQEVAQIGHWRLNLQTMQLEWSDVIYKISGTDPKTFGADLNTFLNMIHPEDREFVEKAYNESVENRTIYDINHRIVRPNGDVCTVHEKCITHYDERGIPLYSLGVVQDITEQVKAEKELEVHRNHLEELVKLRTDELAVANKKLQDEIENEKQIELLLKESLQKEKEVNELKSRFISTTSHEFRTPLTSILSSVQLIQRYRNKWDEDKLEDQFLRIKNSVTYLTNLLNDVLTISHADSGRIIFNPQLIDLHQFCEEVIEEVKHKMGEGHIFRFTFTSKKKEFFLDAKLIRFIIRNLLSNAFKYSPRGGKVKLAVSSTEKHIQIEVSDQGIGILPEDREHLFKPFYRSRNTGDIEGTGLGLSIVQRAVELHKGTIKYFSKPNESTRFIIKIPKNNEQKNTDN